MKFVLAAAVASSLFVTPTFAAEVPQPLVAAYLNIQAALAADKLEGIATEAATADTAATALGQDGAKIAAAAKKLQASKDLTAARAAFGEMSEALLSYADKTKSGFGADVRIAFCPMVDKPWLQKEKEIRNPYYGGAMISCGTFRTKN